MSSADFWFRCRAAVIGLILAGVGDPALAQSGGGFAFGQTLPAAALNAAFQGKQDLISGGDCKIVTGSITCTKSNGSLFSPSATIDTTNASNISSGVLAAGRLPSTLPITAPVNLAPNSQWEIWSGVNDGTAMNPGATGFEPTIAASANTTGTAGTVTFTVTSTGDLSVGDLIRDGGGDANLALAPMRVTALVANTSITARVPRSLSASTSSASTITPIQIGANWYTTSNTGSGPDGWNRVPTTSATGPILWRDLLHGNYSVNAPSTVTPQAALGVKLQTSTGSSILIETSNAPSSPPLQQFLGKTVVFGAYVKQTIQGGSGTWNIRFNVGGTITNCANAPSNVGLYQWQECSVTVPNNATFLYAGVSFNGNTGDAYDVVDPVLAIGSYIGGVQNYQKPYNQTFIPIVHVASNFWVNQTITFPASNVTCGNATLLCFIFDPYADTGGQVAPTVVKAHGQLEGYDDGAVQVDTGFVRIMAYYNQFGAPELSGSFMAQHVAGVKEFSYMDFPFLTNTTADMLGTGIFQTNVASDTWKNVSIEMDDFVLQ